MLLRGNEDDDDDGGGVRKDNDEGLKKGKKGHHTEWLKTNTTTTSLLHFTGFAMLLLLVSRWHPVFRSQGCCVLLQCLRGLVRPWDHRSIAPDAVILH